MIIPTHTLNDGSEIPAVGFGTYPLKGDEGQAAIRAALNKGYRLIDTAVNYGNEEEVGRALAGFLADTSVDRAEITVQTKLPGRHHDYDAALASIEESVARLGVDQIDVMLIHWPNPSVGKYTDAWRALIEARERGLVRSVGVSNFTAEHLQTIVDATDVVPVLNQIELHPFFTQHEMRAAHAEMDILTQAWSPLGKNSPVLEDDAVAEIARAHGKTPGQVVLRWHVQSGVVPLPKSGTPSRQAENIEIFDFELTDAEMAAIDALHREDGRWFGGDPDTHEEM